jgi:hypothetical protein
VDSVAVDTAGGALISVRVTPRSSRTRIAGVRHGVLLVTLGAAPVDGAANAALVKLLADRLGIARRAISLVSGARSRTKRLSIDGLSAADVQARLSALVDAPRSPMS